MWYSLQAVMQPIYQSLGRIDMPQLEVFFNFVLYKIPLGQPPSLCRMRKPDFDFRPISFVAMIA
jgi:hypothetical protein